MQLEWEKNTLLSSNDLQTTYIPSERPFFTLNISKSQQMPPTERNGTLTD